MRVGWPEFRKVRLVRSKKCLDSNEIQTNDMKGCAVRLGPFWSGYITKIIWFAKRPGHCPLYGVLRVTSRDSHDVTFSLCHELFCLGDDFFLAISACKGCKASGGPVCRRPCFMLTLSIYWRYFPLSSRSWIGWTAVCTWGQNHLMPPPTPTQPTDTTRERPNVPKQTPEQDTCLYSCN